MVSTFFMVDTIGLPRYSFKVGSPAAYAVFVAALGAIHEYSEIFTHHHALEIADIVVNAISAAIGVALARILVPAVARA
jgi:arginine exporter protein ArgO